MPTITINGTRCEFTPGEKIIAVADRAGVDIPKYCYHEGLSIPAQCRICLAEIWAPNARNNNKLEPMMGGKLQPTCSTDAADGMVVYTTSPKAVANQKAVMEYLLINHPLDCPVCDQAGECWLQDYSYQYGRGVSRFEEQKVKQPKKDLGPHVLLYADRCIMCTRCVRFDREVAGAGQLMIGGRGDRSEIDVFPGVALDNELSGNVIDLCPVGALLDKDFLFAQRVWFLRQTPSIDGITASGDNIWIEHNEGRIYRVKPRRNLEVNRWWITDEVRYGWKFVHADHRLRSPLRREHGVLVESDYTKAYDQAIETLRAGAEGRRLALVVSPMLPCEEAYALAQVARTIDPEAVLSVGPVPYAGEDKTFPPGDENGFRMYAEKAPNARGVRRVLEAVAGAAPLEHDALLERLRSGGARSDIGAVLLTGNYPSAWVTDELAGALANRRVVLIDTLESDLMDAAEVVLPGATWAEKAGTFQNARDLLQAFEQAIPVIAMAKSEGQIAADMLSVLAGKEIGRPPIVGNVLVIAPGPGSVPAATSSVRTPRAALFDAAKVRGEMAARHDALSAFRDGVSLPEAPAQGEPDVEVVEL